MTFAPDTQPVDPALLTPVQRLTRDLASAARTISDAEARFLVDAYYSMQDQRIRADGQIRSIVKNPVDTGDVDPATGDPMLAVEPHDVLKWLSVQNSTLEGQVKRALEKYVAAHPVGAWLTSVHGIGPVISAGLLAHIDITKAPTVGHIWRFAGLDPSVKWEKKTKRPWNAQLKVLTWKAGESFVKFSNADECAYGHIWKARKEMEVARNEAGLNAEEAEKKLAAHKFGKDTTSFAAYSVGKLPAAHVHARARRYAVKHFLSDLHAVWHFIQFGTLAPKPWVIEHEGHVHLREPVNADRVPGLREAMRARG
jgi:Transposase IS116/IS110/IS902 family